MSNYRPSFYNIEAMVDNDRVLFFNSVSGAIAWINNDIANIIKTEKNISDENLELANELHLKGFLVCEEEDEWSKLLYERQAFIFNPNPTVLGFVIAPTLQCNLSCPYCFEKDGRSLSTMTEDIVEQSAKYIISQISRMPTVRELYIAWFGGEPCLQVDKIRKIYSLLLPIIEERNLKYESRIVTNGSLLTKDVSVFLNNKCGVCDAQITIDGLHDNYSKRKSCSPHVLDNVVHNIELAADILNINLRINVDQENADEMSTLLKWLLDEHNLNGKINIYFAQIQRWNDCDNRSYLDDFSYLEFINGIHKKIINCNWQKTFNPKRPVRQVGPCGSMRSNNCTIGPDGKLHRCEHCLNHPEWAIGDVYTGRYYNEADMKYLLEMPMEKCRTCKAFPICAGGCLSNKILHNIPPLNCMNYIDLIKEQVKFAAYSKNKA